MKAIGSFLAAVVLALGVASCGGGGTNSDSSSFDPTGSAWEFLVTAADAGDTLYTLTFFDSTGAKAASGVFTAVSAGGASYSGSWASTDNVVTGASSGAFVFTLTVDADTTAGTVDYVTPEGSGSTAATRVDATATACNQYVGTWTGSYSGKTCTGDPIPQVTITVRSDCTASWCGNRCLEGYVDGAYASFVSASTSCQGTMGVIFSSGTFDSATSISGTTTFNNTGVGTWTATKQ